MHGQRKIKTQTNEVQRIWETICENHPYYHYFQIKVQIIFNVTMLYDFSDEINTSLLIRLQKVSVHLSHIC